jgi:hypothetical protein
MSSQFVKSQNELECAARVAKVRLGISFQVPDNSSKLNSVLFGCVLHVRDTLVLDIVSHVTMFDCFLRLVFLPRARLKRLSTKSSQKSPKTQDPRSMMPTGHGGLPGAGTRVGMGYGFPGVTIHVLAVVTFG